MKTRHYLLIIVVLGTMLLAYLRVMQQPLFTPVGRTIGYCLGPLFIGALGALVIATYRRVRGRPLKFWDTLLGTTVGTLVLVIAVTSFVPFGRAKAEIRNDALRLMGVSVAVPGLTAYCDQKVGHDPELIAAAVSWNQRNEMFMKNIAAAVEWSGKMTQEEKAAYNSVADFMVRRMVEGSPDRVAYCHGLIAQFNNNAMDLDKSKGTAPLLRTIMAVDAQ